MGSFLRKRLWHWFCPSDPLVHFCKGRACKCHFSSKEAEAIRDYSHQSLEASLEDRRERTEDSLCSVVCYTHSTGTNILQWDVLK